MPFGSLLERGKREKALAEQIGDSRTKRRPVLDSMTANPWKSTLERLALAGRPRDLVLGLNYSGMHDSAVALVTRKGEILLAASLERVSRVKQDGRPPDPLLEGMPWEAIEAVAVSTDERPWSPAESMSALHPQPLPSPRARLLEHGSDFSRYLDSLAAPRSFVCHQLSHAASAFWPSGFEEALCLTYDGGMCNSPWFGGLYRAGRATGISPLDRFAASHYAKITSLYSIVTALLGFTPNRHEGKVTGLAAYGEPSRRCRFVLERLFTADYYFMESLLEWRDVYSRDGVPTLAVDPMRLAQLRPLLSEFSREVVAATLQEMTEEHVLEILERARRKGWICPDICLSGGLFANVRLNRRIKDLGFRSLFVAPAMTDDGTALGAALAVASSKAEFAPRRLPHVFLGPSFEAEETESALDELGLTYRRAGDVEEQAAAGLATGRVVGLFQSRAEFGPRALGHRSILCRATEREINATLNERLRRTEFMPFAPIVREEDAHDCFTGLEGVEHAAEFMTITCRCTERTAREAPAVVHLDGTARPQLVREDVSPFLHRILSVYRRLTGNPLLINTSFNVHEEPIVCTPADAIRGFLEAGLDDLCFEDGYLLSIEDNARAACAHLRRRLAEPGAREGQLQATIEQLSDRLGKCEADRLVVTRSLEAIAEERLELIWSLEAEAEARLELIRSLEAAAAARLECVRGLEERIRLMEASRSWRWTSRLRGLEHLFVGRRRAKRSDR